MVKICDCYGMKKHNKFFNSHFIINKCSEIALYHKKLHLLVYFFELFFGLVRENDSIIRSSVYWLRLNGEDL
jgi:hypothetical protein